MARILNDYPGVSLRAEDLSLGLLTEDGKIDFVRIFGRCGPVHIEIGSGKAAFLLNQAKTQPDDDFLGIEWASRYYRYAVDRVGRWGLTNVRIIRAEAAAFLADFVPDNSVSCFHIYFPDPWPKKRHHKRRFFCAANLEEMLRCLKKDGQLRIATDHAGYFEQIRQVLTVGAGRCAWPGFEEIKFFPAAGADQGEWVGTNFERRYLKDQRTIYTLAVRKT